MAKGKGNKRDKKVRKATGNAPPENEDDATVENNDVLDPEDFEYFQDSRRSFAFLHQVTEE